MALSVRSQNLNALAAALEYAAAIGGHIADNLQKLLHFPPVSDIHNRQLLFLVAVPFRLFPGSHGVLA